MRAFKIISFIIAILLLTSCEKSKITGWLCVENNTRDSLYIETKVYSEWTDEIQQFSLAADDFRCIAQSLRQREIDSGIDISEYVYNEDAYVKVFIKDSTGNMIAVKEWKYSERYLEGRQLFNEEHMVIDKQYSVLNNLLYSHTFYYSFIQPWALIGSSRPSGVTIEAPTSGLARWPMMSKVWKSWRNLSCFPIGIVKRSL